MTTSISWRTATPLDAQIGEFAMCVIDARQTRDEAWNDKET
ncbi:hypothetical protein [Humibacter ginsenosidimutans]|nr:hypothetical protein [Humibacter ginsenosidimutans]